MRQKRAFATFQSGGLGPGGSRGLFHLIVIIQSDIYIKQDLLQMLWHTKMESLPIAANVL